MKLHSTAARIALLTVVAVGAIAGCSAGSGTRAGTGSGSGDTPADGAASAGAGSGDKACSGGLTGHEPGVVLVTCNGTASVHFAAGTVTRDIHGGVCHSTSDGWSASVGVIIDVTGVHGKYTGPPVDGITVNDTSTPGSGTIQATIGGKDYYDLGGAAMTIAADRRSAQLQGTCDRTCDAPGTKITVTVTC